MLDDFRSALRMVRLHPWLSAAIVSVLALGLVVAALATRCTGRSVVQHFAV